MKLLAQLFYSTAPLTHLQILRIDPTTRPRQILRGLGEIGVGIECYQRTEFGLKASGESRS
jgi:hypothetical protein